MTLKAGGLGAFENSAIHMLLRGLAAMLRADWGYPASPAAWPLRRSAFILGQLGTGDAERLELLAWRWEPAQVPPSSAEFDRQFVDEQIAALLPGWLG